MAKSAPLDFAWTIVCKAHAPHGAPRMHALLEPLVARLENAWRSNKPLFVEDLLAETPELSDRPDAALRLLYEEVHQRRKLGKSVKVAELRHRFPHWRHEVAALLASCSAAEMEPQYPREGETLGDFTLQEPLGHGTQGRVFLAAQRPLANRPVVLKLTALDGEEHLSLARLQHTHIVPLYTAQDWPALNLRMLVFPYLGRVTWRVVQTALEPIPLAKRRGEHLLGILDSHEPSVESAASPARERLARESYVEAVCRIGASLAETLHFAHERGLVHFDVKPSNVLLATDGEPLLLDFHLAQEPLEPGQPRPEAMGGTAGYMAPEQERIFEAIIAGRPIAERVDRRADLYSLGVVLYEALSGKSMACGGDIAPLHRVNAQVSVGLSDIVHKCLASSPDQRYETGAALADDLRRHIENRPLRGVGNRSLAEMWTKWRKRLPYALPLGGLAAVGMAASAVVGGLRGQ